MLIYKDFAKILKPIFKKPSVELKISVNANDDK